MAHTCQRCGSERIAPPVPLTAPAPGGLLSQLRGRVCADCGYTELYADNPMGVFLAHQEAVDAAPGPGPGPAVNLQCPHCGSVIPAAEARCDACGWSQPA